MPTSDDFLHAVRAGDVALVTQLLDADPSLVNTRDEQGVSALMTALYNGKSDVLALLRSRGATIDVFAAAALGDVDRLQTLLNEESAEFDGYSPDGWTPLHLAVFFGHLDAARLLLSQYADVHASSQNPLANQPLHAAAARGNVELVTLLLNAGATVNAMQQGNFTALHSAAFNGNEPLVRLLLERGADPLIPTSDGQSAAALAEEKGHAMLAELIRAHASGAVQGTL